MNKFKLHNVQFFNYQPQAIQCMAYDEDSELLAVGRFDSTIEIWDMKYTPYQESIIPSYSENSVEAIAWYNGRLFAVGLNAQIAEYDLVKLSPKYTYPVHSGACHCMAVNPRKALIAVGTENGYVCLFKIKEELAYDKTFSKQEGRIICIAWHPSGKIIVTGSVDVIRIWDVKSGYASDRIIVGRVQPKKETVVWCLGVTSDFTIISGDSCGRTSFWDGKTTTLIDSTKIHKADILALSLNNDEKHLYVSGVDPVIIQFVLVQSATGHKWVKAVQRRLHTHDVRALVHAKEFLVSGGIDTYLTLSKYPPKTQIQCSPFPKNYQVCVARKAHCLLLNYSNALEVWQLGKTDCDSGNNGAILPLSSKEQKILQFKCKNNETIICCSLSDDGRWLAYSSVEKLKLFHFSLEEESFATLSQSNFHKVRLLPKECNVAQSMIFTPEGKYLVIITPEQVLQVLKLDIIQPTLIHSIPKFKEDKYRYSLLSVSSDGSYVACADTGGNVAIYNLSEGKIHSILPHHKGQATALSFHLHSNNLIVVYSDQQLVEYSLEKMGYTNLSKRYRMLETLGVSLYYAITGVSFAPADKNLILLYDNSQIYLINRTEKKGEMAKRHCNEEKETTREAPLSTSKQHKHILSLNHLTGEELVAVVITPRQIMTNLPPPLWQKRFGT